jgi:NTP pyrophosphatase (non-canonical NTP hydrolase)
MTLTFDDYQKRAIETAVYPKAGLNVVQWDGIPDFVPCGFIYPALGLAGESGECLEKFKKILRDKNGHISEEDKIAIAKELGDCFWYLAALCHELNLNMSSVAQGNLDKLASRQARGTLSGSGDNR